MKRMFVFVAMALALCACRGEDPLASLGGFPAGQAERKPGELLQDYDESEAGKQVNAETSSAQGIVTSEDPAPASEPGSETPEQPLRTGSGRSPSASSRSRGSDSQTGAFPPAGTDVRSGSPEDALLTSLAPGKGHLYSNRFFGFDLSIPDGWYSTTTEALHRLFTRTLGKQFSLETARDSGAYILLVVSRFPPAQRGPRGELNSHLLLCAAVLASLPGIRTEKDYIDLLELTVKETGGTIEKPPTEVQLGEIKFWKVEGTRWNEEWEHVEYIATVRKGYALSFQLTASSKGVLVELEEMLTSLHVR